ncbi:MAG: TolC family protein, partial [Bacteroidales bacterium]|nr:TolC family protein [Bacteroidales bacterium]
VAVAKRVFDNIAKKYEFGVASSLDVTNSGTNLIAAQSSYVQSLLEIVNAQISLEQLLNK